LGVLVSIGARAESELAAAIETGRRGAALELIAEGADVNAAQGDGTTPLHWAAYKLDLELVGLLLERGAKADVENRYGASPLAEAVKAGNTPSSSCCSRRMPTSTRRMPTARRR
jgi:ankyrin repeat protein